MLLNNTSGAMKNNLVVSNASCAEVSRHYVVIFYLASVLGTMVLLNRWLVTDLGVSSFGRVWQYYVSYLDFGFFRRGLIGSLFTLSGLNRVISDVYVFAYLVYAVKVLAFATLILWFFLKNSVFDSWHGYAAVFFSPAFILQSGYLTGTQDLQLLILAAIAILFLKSWWALAVIGIAGVFMHEFFIFMFPAIGLLFCIKKNKGLGFQGEDFFGFGLSFLVVFSALMVAVFFGVDVDRAQFESTLMARMGDAVGMHSLWSGYFEIFSSVEENADIGKSSLSKVRDVWMFALVPVVYSLILPLLLACFIKGEVWKKLVLIVFLCLPISAIFVAGDFYRWVGMSANLALLAIILLHKERLVKFPKVVFIGLLVFSFFAPFGGAGWERPFPAHQMLWEKM